jgi:hypothetical protein
MPDDKPDIPVLKCWHCDFGTKKCGNGRCPRCGGTGSVFWVGYAYPYTPDGEKAARKHLATIRS